MFAGVCGKRIGFEEIFGSSTPSTSAKRPRCSSLDLEFGSEDKVSVLLRMFPSMDREVMETILNAHNNKMEDAIESLHVLCLCDVSAKGKLQGPDSVMIGNGLAIPGGESSQTYERKFEDFQECGSNFDFRNLKDGFAWVDIIVQEMMSATDLDDAKGRATRILEAFEQSVASNLWVSEQELTFVKEHLHSLLRDNQILKRAVSIQHEHNLEQEEKMREVLQLKHVISQCQEQVRSLELNNYTLKLHLQRAEERSSIPGRFHPDVF